MKSVHQLIVCIVIFTQRYPRMITRIKTNCVSISFSWPLFIMSTFDDLNDLKVLFKLLIMSTSSRYLVANGIEVFFSLRQIIRVQSFSNLQKRLKLLVGLDLLWKPQTFKIGVFSDCKHFFLLSLRDRPTLSVAWLIIVQRVVFR